VNTITTIALLTETKEDAGKAEYHNLHAQVLRFLYSKQVNVVETTITMIKQETKKHGIQRKTKNP
jgi:hypothetical protein